MRKKIIVVLLILAAVFTSVDFGYDSSIKTESISPISPPSMLSTSTDSLMEPYNFSYELKSELLSDFDMLVLSPTMEEIYIAFNDRVVSYYRNWTYFVEYDNGERELIYDAYSDDVDMDGVADIAIITQDHNIHVVDGASGEPIWRAYPTFVEPYTKIKILDVMAQKGKEVLIWTFSSDKIYVWSAAGFPLLEIQIAGAQSILDLAAADVNESIEGEELVIFYYDANGMYKIRCMNLIENDILFDVSVLTNITGNPYMYTYLTVGNVSKDEGREIIVGAVPSDEIGTVYIEVLNSTGKNPSIWNETINISVSENWLKMEVVDYDFDGENEIVVFSKFFVCVANNYTDLELWQVQGSGQIYDATASYCDETSTYEFLVLWRSDENLTGAYIGYINKSASYVYLDAETLIGANEGLYSAMRNRSVIVALNYGSFVVVYDGTNKVDEKRFVIPMNILEDEQYNNFFVVWSYSGFIVYDQKAEKVFDIEYTTPELIQYIKIGNYYTSSGIEILVVSYIPEEYIFIRVYNLDGDKIFEYDNINMLNNNLTITNIGPIIPDTNNMSLIVASTTNDTYYMGILDVSSEEVYTVSTLAFEADIIKYGYIDGNYVWVICEKYGQRVYLADSSGRIIGIKEFKDVMIQDVDMYDIDLDDSDEILVYLYDIPWDVFKYVVCSGHLVEMFEISNIRTKPRVYDVLYSVSGKEILSVRKIGSEYYLYLYSYNGSNIFSLSFGRQEHDGIYLWNNSRVDNQSLILVADVNGKEASLVMISDEDEIKAQIETITTENFTFTENGLLTSPYEDKIGICFVRMNKGSISIMELKAYFDRESPELYVYGENIEFVNVLGRYISSGRNVTFIINASDDSEIATLIYNISSYDRENNRLSQEQHIENVSTKKIEKVVEADLLENVFNLTIEVQVFDSVGKNNTQKITVYVDQYDPEISTLFPDGINISSDKIEVKAYVWDDLWIYKVYIEIGNTIIPMIPAMGTVSPGQTVIYSAEISSNMIQNPSTQANLTAIDFTGKKTILSFIIYKEKPEEIFEIPVYIWILAGAVVGIIFIVMLPYIISAIRKIKRKIEERIEKRREEPA